MAQAFNEFYASITPKLDQSLLHSTTNPLNFPRGGYSHSMAVPVITSQDVITTFVLIHKKAPKTNYAITDLYLY